MLKKSLRIFLGFEGKNVNENEICELLLAFYSKAMRWSRAGENINTMAYMEVDGWFSGGGWLKKTFLLLSVLDACFSAANTKIYIFVC